ncbi:hypothetical protein CFC21_011997 [Triticum aestivum]|uniref:DUF7731 domain-containing protein n=3 Tax=Triticinae TaxID=1648030 RepID=A0A9R1IWM5_WHEAT|nr:glycine-rich cell wall structural protein-like [Triticum aestivum]KAF6995507.1 hypothetical protein CFC21_011997 [Triticum aestivum]
MASFKLTNLCFIVVMFSAVFSCCRGQGGGGGAGAGAGGGAGGGSGIGAVVPGTQDSVQIVAQAALCFDNRPVLTGCLQAMGINASGTGASMPPPAPGGAATAIMCSPPCFGHVTMMMSCVNAIFGNFVTYNPGLMQGVQAVFQMSCGNVNGPGGAGGAAGGMGGRPAGNAGGGAGAGGMGGGPAGNAGGGAGAGSASGGVGGGAAGGIPNGIGGPGGIPNSIGGAAGAAGASGGGAGGTTNIIGGAAGGGAGAGGASGGAGGGNGTTNGGAATGAIGSGNITSVSPNAGSHVAVSNQSQPTSSAGGPALGLKGACSSSVLVIWAGAWLVLF